jgi:hypothetical protein
MMKNKPFDCVKMKNAIQERLQKEYQGLTPDEVRKKRRQKLSTSRSIVARKWRRLMAAEKEKKSEVVR